MKKFEEVMQEELSPTVITERVCAVSTAYHDVNYYSESDIVELSEGWVSPVDYQNIVASKKALEKSNLKMSEENAKFVVENIELTKEIAELKSQLEKQKPEIPEVPQFVADWLDRKPLYAINGSISVEVIEWAQKQTGYADLGMNISHLLKLKVNGYTVKQKWFYLKSDKQLYDEGEEHGAFLDLYLDNNGDFVTDEINARKFTQAEIDSMDTGRYEIIEVEE